MIRALGASSLVEPDQEEKLQGYVAGLRGEPEPVGQEEAFRRGWAFGLWDRQRGMKKPARGGLARNDG